MIHIDKSKCVRCGACIRDCVVNVPRGYEVGAVLLFGIPDVAYARVPHPRPMSVDMQ